MNSIRTVLYDTKYFTTQILENVKVYKIIRNFSIRKFPKKLKEKEDSDIPKNVVQPYITAHLQPKNGIPYDIKPFKMLLEKDKSYLWCLCGQGHTQPLCDRTHRDPLLRIEFRPIRFVVSETKEYWLCNCKQTKNRPFCDGSHRDQWVIDQCKSKHSCCG